MIFYHQLTDVDRLAIANPAYAQQMNVRTFPSKSTSPRIQHYPFPGVCGFWIDNTVSLLLTTQKL